MNHVTNAPRHARLFELIRQQNLASAACPETARDTTELTDAQHFIASARKSLHAAA
ncbi:hypothetical protein [Lentibacter sp. XHP0401]|jgi:hypothetical protein|uniref:hypothetical protein n=1 Tax=Lentibacter sp. XHP0401 TaxID=2984334 RepID=UPI0021E7C41B|nr:hypothetical protein [Lentibacter sp. XHP0401]MCV2892180.1 hypothetical protein [Lentibacter sp. XHP0401]